MVVGSMTTSPTFAQGKGGEPPGSHELGRRLLTKIVLDHQMLTGAKGEGVLECAEYAALHVQRLRYSSKPATHNAEHNCGD